MPDTATHRDRLTQLVLGFHVSRATAALPQTAAAAIFTVSTGRVAITQIVGQVTTAIQNQANNTKLTATPTSGTAVDMCAVANTANKEIGAKLGISGVAADALLVTNAGAVRGQDRRVIVGPGTIDLDCAASNTGSVKWDLWYFPLDAGAVVTAA